MNSTTRLDEFREYRSRMNGRIAEANHLGINRFFNLDTAAYNDGALPGKTKELLGLVASAVLRCNDCIDYHLIQCVETGWSDGAITDALNVALIVGGSIVIPHLRHALETIDLLRLEKGGIGTTKGARRNKVFKRKWKAARVVEWYSSNLREMPLW